jgi:hypothetical protein
MVHSHIEPAALPHRFHTKADWRSEWSTTSRRTDFGAASDVVVLEPVHSSVLRASMTDSGRRCHRRQRRSKQKGVAIQASSSSSKSGPPTTSILSLTHARNVKPSKDINIRPT